MGATPEPTFCPNCATAFHGDGTFTPPGGPVTVPDTPQPRNQLYDGPQRQNILHLLAANKELRAERDALAATLATTQAELERMTLAYIEATNPGIDMDKVRRSRALLSDTPDTGPEET